MIGDAWFAYLSFGFVSASVIKNDTKGDIVILGATGNTGLQLVEQALARNYKVLTPVRTPAKLAHLQHKHLKVVECDILNPLELTKHFEGRDAVLSALGHPGLTISEVTFYENSMKSIITAMREAKVKRLICMTSFYSKYLPERYPLTFKLAIRPMLGRHLDSMSRMEDFLEKECQDIDYTIVRPPRLIDGHIIEKEMKVCEDDYFFPDFSTANKTPRANVARFMLDTLKNQTYIRQGVAIDLPKMLDKSG